MREAKISFGFSPETRTRHAKIVIDGMSIPLIKKDSNEASSTKNDPHKSDLSKEEITNMVKKILSGVQDNKYEKTHYGIFRNLLYLQHSED